MLEIHGKYFNKETSEALKVLVQFDGRALHIWHQSDPFYHLTSSPDFSISSSSNRATGSIKLKKGGWIETNDLHKLKLLQKKLQGIDRKQTLNTFKLSTAIILFAIAMLFYGIWCITRHGL